MKETRFIAQNQEKWKEFEMLLLSDNLHPDDLQRMYIQITDDLSFARTFYPNRSVRVYLNGLAQKVFSKLYKTKKSPLGRFVDYWRYDLPLLVWESRWEFLLALGIFLIAIAVGVISTMIDPEFPRMILGDDYVNETIKNIESGDPMKIYKGGNQLSDAMGITANNIFVALRTFVFGVFAGIGTILILLQNGIMVGCFQYFFVAKGFGWQSFLAIWLHGTFEISAIVIAGAAGLTVGKGILFPATYTRMQAFQRGARRGFEIMTGIIPLFLVAGFVEGFFTRYTDAPNAIRFGFILLCAAIVIGYFVVYPWYLSKKRFLTSLQDHEIFMESFEKINIQQIRTVSEVLADSFVIFRKIFGKILTFSTLFSIVYIGIFFYLTPQKTSEALVFNNSASYFYQDSLILFLLAKLFEPFSALLVFFNNPSTELLWLLNALSYSLFINIIIILIQKVQDEAAGFSFKNFVINFLLLAPICLVFHSILSIEYGLLVFVLVVLFLGVLLSWLWATFINGNIFRSLSQSVADGIGQFGYNIGFNFLLILIGLVFFLVSNTFIWNLIIEFFMMQFYTTKANEMEVILKGFTVVMVTHVFMAFFIIAGGLYYHSIKEIQDAKNISSKLLSIKIKKRVRGLEVE